MAAGIDAASMARRCQAPFKRIALFSRYAEISPRQGGQGLGAAADRRDAGIDGA
jgi:hypothetical protein